MLLLDSELLEGGMLLVVLSEAMGVEDGIEIVEDSDDGTGVLVVRAVHTRTRIEIGIKTLVVGSMRII